ncbi:MAG: hypothetical protein ACYDH5_17885 [Acidimicrobiales bacterium]
MNALTVGLVVAILAVTIGLLVTILAVVAMVRFGIGRLDAKIDA